MPAVCCATMESARKVVIAEWHERQPVHLDTSGNWHECSYTRCRIRHLHEQVCLQGGHIVLENSCVLHPESAVVDVADVYVCEEVGEIHVCDQATCKTDGGRCIISKKCCVASMHSGLVVSATNKRCRRRPSNAHTNEQAACILLYNLLFSARRVASEVQRSRNVLEIARRRAQRNIKMAIRDSMPLSHAKLLDIYVSARQRMGCTMHLFRCNSNEHRKQVCKHFAAIALRTWDILMPSLPARSTFECTCAALLYAMRKGVAFDGLYAVPPNRFLAYALPDAHSIKEVDISRRALTQARNAMFQAIQERIHNGHITVEKFRQEFELFPEPTVISRVFQNNSDFSHDDEQQ